MHQSIQKMVQGRSAYAPTLNNIFFHAHFFQVFAVHDNHRHNNLQPSKRGYDLGMLGVLIHVLGDAANNVGVIISALVIWLTTYPARYYADPAVSMAIAIVILTTSIPLGANAHPTLQCQKLTSILFSEEFRQNPTRKCAEWYQSGRRST